MPNLEARNRLVDRIFGADVRHYAEAGADDGKNLFLCNAAVQYGTDNDLTGKSPEQVKKELRKHLRNRFKEEYGAVLFALAFLTAFITIIGNIANRFTDWFFEDAQRNSALLKSWGEQ